MRFEKRVNAELGAILLVGGYSKIWWLYVQEIAHLGGIFPHINIRIEECYFLQKLIFLGLFKTELEITQNLWAIFITSSISQIFPRNSTNVGLLHSFPRQLAHSEFFAHSVFVPALSNFCHLLKCASSKCASSPQIMPLT